MSTKILYESSTTPGNATYRSELRVDPEDDQPVGYINWEIKKAPPWIAGRPFEAYVDTMMIAQGSRRRGLGSRFYQAWEQRLPARVRHVTLHPHGGPGTGAARFWQKHGFKWRYADIGDRDAPEAYEMIKGVHGIATPPPFRH